MVNAYLLYNEEAVRRMQVAEFRENIIMSLTQKRRDDQGEEPSEGTKHMLIETDERTSDNRKKRGPCTACYFAIAAKEGPSIAWKKAKLVSTNAVQTRLFLLGTFPNSPPQLPSTSELVIF